MTHPARDPPSERAPSSRPARGLLQIPTPTVPPALVQPVARSRFPTATYLHPPSARGSPTQDHLDAQHRRCRHWSDQLPLSSSAPPLRPSSRPPPPKPPHKPRQRARPTPNASRPHRRPQSATTRPPGATPPQPRDHPTVQHHPQPTLPRASETTRARPHALVDSRTAQRLKTPCHSATGAQTESASKTPPSPCAGGGSARSIEGSGSR